MKNTTNAIDDIEPIGKRKIESLNIRQYYAAKAMQSLLISENGNIDNEKLSKYSFDIADSMIAFEEKENGR